MKTYFVDTNYFLRLLIKDNDTQFKKVYDFFQQGLERKIKLATSATVIFEIYWVLKSFYKTEKLKCIDHLTKILQMDFIFIENKQIFLKAIQLFKINNIDFEDCCNIAFFKEFSFDKFATFDKKVLQLLK